MRVVDKLKADIAYLERKISEAIACHHVEKMRRTLKGALIRQDLKRAVSP